MSKPTREELERWANPDALLLTGEPVAGLRRASRLALDLMDEVDAFKRALGLKPDEVWRIVNGEVVRVVPGVPPTLTQPAPSTLLDDRVWRRAYALVFASRGYTPRGAEMDADALLAELRKREGGA